jgi:hypothetical protein
MDKLCWIVNPIMTFGAGMCSGYFLGYENGSYSLNEISYQFGIPTFLGGLEYGLSKNLRVKTGDIIGSKAMGPILFYVGDCVGKFLSVFQRTPHLYNITV